MTRTNWPGSLVVVLALAWGTPGWAAHGPVPSDPADVAEPTAETGCERCDGSGAWRAERDEQVAGMWIAGLTTATLLTVGMAAGGGLAYWGLIQQFMTSAKNTAPWVVAGATVGVVTMLGAPLAGTLVANAVTDLRAGFWLPLLASVGVTCVAVPVACGSALACISIDALASVSLLPAVLILLAGPATAGGATGLVWAATAEPDGAMSNRPRGATSMTMPY